MLAPIPARWAAQFQKIMIMIALPAYCGILGAMRAQILKKAWNYLVLHHNLRQIVHTAADHNLRQVVRTTASAPQNSNLYITLDKPQTGFHMTE